MGGAGPSPAVGGCARHSPSPCPAARSARSVSVFLRHLVRSRLFCVRTFVGLVFISTSFTCPFFSENLFTFPSLFLPAVHQFVLCLWMLIIEQPR